ncbi:MAG: NUDIX domain-containing protein [Lachnospiraceae bacterium]|jgi:ADP-ribose pyrophosphatase YjhB (NUDIX family)|nr:NUDIX domain-containing protein [Lachnospiraceae bacterium]
MRFTARALLKNRNTGKILLIKYLDRESKSTQQLSSGFWAMPGGGVERGEDFSQALKREIYEETGIEDIEIKDCLMSRNIFLELTHNQDQFYYERYYLVETDADIITQEHLTINEMETIKNYRWWSVEEIKNTNEVIFPKRFPHFIDKILREGKEPVDITDVDDLLEGWH